MIQNSIYTPPIDNNKYPGYITKLYSFQILFCIRLEQTNDIKIFATDVNFVYYKPYRIINTRVTVLNCICYNYSLHPLLNNKSPGYYYRLYKKQINIVTWVFIIIYRVV